MNKVAFFAFKGELMCFVHVLLNAFDVKEKGTDAKIIIEGEAVKLIKDLEESRNPIYLKAKEMGLIDCICKACSVKLAAYDYNKNIGIRMSDELSGHPPMMSYIEDGYEIITM